MITHVAFIVAVTAIIVLAWRNLRENFEIRVPSGASTIHFMTATETAQFLEQDRDAYVHNLSPTDLYARDVTSPTEYISNIKKVATSFDSMQQKRYKKACKAADDYIMSLKGKVDLPVDDIVAIPWILAYTVRAEYEDGLPHTRANIIFVSSDVDETHEPLVRTLVHEKIHIYQRMYPERMTQWLEAHGYDRWKQRMGEPRIRANPDLDPWIYIDPSTDKPMAAYYNSDKPMGIMDVYLTDMTFEHPYERMAYELSRMMPIASSMSANSFP